MFPVVRPRRLRRTPGLRALVRETRLAAEQLIAPIFVVPGAGVREPIATMPGVFRLSVDEAELEVRALETAGAGGVILFGVLTESAKDAEGSAAWDPEGPVATLLRRLRAGGTSMQLWADVCMCEYTSHGHCGILRDDGHVDNDATLPALARAAVAYSEAGADAVAPSDMMDGRVCAIRNALDTAGHTDVAIVSYAVKYASAFYGPFRDAAHSTPSHGDRKAYQMDPANVREGIREAQLDENEGADIVMVKPAGPYLDVISRVREAVTLPVAAYQVSGEYGMLKLGVEAGWLEERRAVLESLVGIRRAGADIIITYYALAAARWLRERLS